jgi:hypothetical protein
MSTLTPDFWKAAAERAIRTFAQAFLALVGATAFDVLHADWASLIGVSLGAAFLSILTSVVASEIGDKGTPSLIEEP